MRRADALSSPRSMASRLKGRISAEIEEIRRRGVAEAIRDLNHGREMEVGQEILSMARRFLSSPQAGALEALRDVQERLALRQYDTLRPFTLEPTSGIRLHQMVSPVSSVAVVSSGDWDSHQPSVLMGVLVAAEVAGVPRRAAFLSPDAKGGLSPLSLHAASLGNATEVYRSAAIPTLVGLRDGAFGFVPETVAVVGGDRRVRAARSILFDPSEPRHGLVVVCDSDAPTETVVGALSSWLVMDPLSPCAVVTTSKKVVRRLEALRRPDPVPSWWDDLASSELVHVSRADEAVEMVNFARPRAVLLVGDSVEARHEEIRADHVFVGMHSDPAALARTVATVAAGVPGVLDLLRVTMTYVATPQASARMRSHLSFLDREEGP